ncbi:excalibur calcium-binding domain-containing protein [Microbulbifer thermotolerans]|nr:excalibur calcium-binding domain-containing protein [Microbulbifer thermotolerans]
METIKLSPTKGTAKSRHDSYQAFKCDGRQYCSQMTSREEAVFFTRNCPNTKMDGDGDGIPCENDSRF